MKKICIITDNDWLYTKLKKIIICSEYYNYKFDFYYSTRNKAMEEKYRDCEIFKPIDLKKTDVAFYDQYCLFLSLHCKQIFPVELVKRCRCVNVHPGYNPYNRGWFPQVFSIINKKMAGVTIHEMDQELDHGAIIYQENVEINSYDTSYDVYTRIQKKEIELLEQHLMDIIEGNYQKTDMVSEGNINYKSDFDRLCCIDLAKEATYGEMLDYLRAMTFQNYDNAFFFDGDGNKVYVSINLKKAED